MAMTNKLPRVTQSEKCKGVRPTLCGTWEARICIKGKHYEETFQTEEEAIAWRKSFEERKKSSPESFLTCGELFPLWLEHLNMASQKADPDYSPQTYVRYESIWKVYFQKYFSKMKMDDLNGELIFKFADHLKDTPRNGKFLHKKTIKNIIGALSNFLKYCRLKRHIKSNPTKDPSFREDFSELMQGRKKFQDSILEKSLSPEEIVSLVDAAYQKGPEFGFTAKFIYSTGIRLGEAAALTCGDISYELDQTAGSVLINKTRFSKTKQVQNKAKSGSNRSIPLSKDLLEDLIQWKLTLKQNGFDVTHKDPLFPSLVRNQKGWSRALRRLAERVVLKNTTAHCLRHSSLSTLSDQGYDLQLLQKFAGHTTVTMTKGYVSTSRLRLNGMANSISQVFIPK